MQADEIKRIYKNQIDALNNFFEECGALLPGRDLSLMRFGGGTALAIYYFQHRMSFDVDLFVTDAQVLDCLRPEFWLVDGSRYFKDDDFVVDLAHHMRFMTKTNVKVDIVSTLNYHDKPLIDSSKNIFDYDVCVESIEDILTKKINYRASQNKSRDIMDIAVALHNDEHILDKLLKKGAINFDDIDTLSKALKNLDTEKYRYQIEAAQPAQKYKTCIQNAQNSIIEACDAALKRREYE
jgi:predicted nucleotidyltransferase component of viral defense system